MPNQTGPRVSASRDLPSPRMYALLATRAPVAVVFRHGPHAHWSIARWDLTTDALTPGAWLHGSLYPRRCDISPDGRLLYAFVLKGKVYGFLGAKGDMLAYSTVSKVPWLFALAAWKETGTWTRGYHFVEGGSPEERPWDIGPPQAGDAGPLRARYGVARTAPSQYAAERRRGWVEHERCPPRGKNDMWDERRRVVLVRARPGRSERLVLTDEGWDTGPGTIEGRRPTYHLERWGKEEVLAEVTWADWDPRGRLLVATADGKLQIRDVDREEVDVRWERDLSAKAVRGPAPESARRW